MRTLVCAHQLRVCFTARYTIDLMSIAHERVCYKRSVASLSFHATDKATYRQAVR